jgi:putative membrane protein
VIEEQAMAFVVRWIVLTLSVWVSTFIVTGIRYDTTQSLLVAALVLGVLNTLVRPLLVIISLPVVLVTLGFFIVVINALLLMLTAKLVNGFHVESFWSAIGGALIVSVVGMLLGVRRLHGPKRVVVTETVYREPGGASSAGRGRVIDVSSRESEDRG